MARNIKDIASEALQLPIADRAELANQLLASLDTVSEEENEQLWLEEAERRYSDYKAATIKAVRAEEVFERVRLRKT